MSKNLWSLAIAAMLCVGLVGYAEAAVTVYETGFENHYFDTGTFAIGNLSGQDGWLSPASTFDQIISDGSLTGKLVNRWGGYNWTVLNLINQWGQVSPAKDVSIAEGIVTVTYRDGFHYWISSESNMTSFTTAADLWTGGPNMQIVSTKGRDYNGRWELRGLTTVDAGPVDAFCDITWKIDLYNNTMSLSGYNWGQDAPVAWGPVSTTIAAGTKLDYFQMGSGNSALTQMENLKITLNRKPIANAGQSQIVGTGLSATGCTASVTLNGSGSSDPDGDLLSYAWAWPGGTASGVSPVVVLPVGVTTVTLTVTSDGNLQNTSQVVITVEDDTPPIITQASLVPVGGSNAEYVVVAAATDNCDTNPSIVAIVGQEVGAGDRVNLPPGQGRGHLLIKGDGPATLTVVATDANLNSTVAVVPIQ